LRNSYELFRIQLLKESNRSRIRSFPSWRRKLVAMNFISSLLEAGKDNETEIVNHFLIQLTPDLERDVNHSFALFEAA